MERIKCPHLAYSVCDHVSRDLKILNCFEKIICISTISDTIQTFLAYIEPIDSNSF